MPDFDILIRNGLVVDGTGRAGFRADVGISNGLIAAIGELPGCTGRILDVEGCVVAPGFIDVHSHTDALVFVNPTCESKVTQGVTTELSGNCGGSSAPRGFGQEDDTEYGEYGIALNWHEMAELLDRIDKLPKTINFATLVGHGNIRAGIVGHDDRPATDDEMKAMCHAVEQAVEDGAFGISTGLIYPPGCYAPVEELIELSRAAASRGGIYATHMRSESTDLIPAVEEALRIGRESGIGVQISHHKASGGPDNWGKVKTTLAMIDEARANGMDVWADQYPYLATQAGIGCILPNWAHDGGNSALLKRLADPTIREKLRQALVQDAESIGERDGYSRWGSIMLGGIDSAKNHRFEAMRVDAAAKLAGKDPIDFVLDILLEEHGYVEMMHFGMCEDDVKTVMRHPAVLIGSDATARTNTGPMSSFRPHPRAWGTFARVLGKYVRDEGVLPLEEAVAKMSGRTASRLGLKRRGLIAEGYFADVTIFDPDRIADTATFEEPKSRAAGIHYVIVNGQIVLDEGRLLDTTECAPGRVLRRGQD